jgi:8-oxo-dGTP diphosphatase
MMVEVAAAIIQEGGRYLITQRRRESHLAGLWEFPGGKRKPGESLEECLRREIREELALEIEIGEKVDQVTYTYEDRTITLHFFRCSIAAGTPTPQEGQTFCWVEPSGFTHYQFPPADAGILRRLSRSAEPT